MSAYGDALTEVRTAIAENAADIFPDLCTIRNSQAASAGGSGGKVRGATIVHADVPCGYRPLRGGERASLAGVNSFADYEIKMPAEISGAQNAVAPKHQIVVAARGTQPAQTFDVVSVQNDRGIYIFCEAARKG